MSHTSCITPRVAIGLIGCTLALATFTIAAQAHEYKAPPEPTITHQPSDTGSEKVGPTGEVVLDVDESRKKLHAQHHPHTPIMTRVIPGAFQKTKLTNIRDYALLKGDLDVINPGPGE
jgi:hypothetical protein